MQTQLTDLDGLIMRVRDSGSRDLISEATVAYRGGALRSAVILCWIAVFNDLIAKVRELGQGGHKAASSYVEELDRNIDNPQSALKFEREIVAKATNEFLMCDSRDRKLFERLREDRNACAHPILAGDDGHFQTDSRVSEGAFGACARPTVDQATRPGERSSDSTIARSPRRRASK